MAYPEPIPAIKGKNAKEFLERLANFKLNAEQKKLYEGSVGLYQRLRPKE
jgi:hypothetical protein